MDTKAGKNTHEPWTFDHSRFARSVADKEWENMRIHLRQPWDNIPIGLTQFTIYSGDEVSASEGGNYKVSRNLEVTNLGQYINRLGVEKDSRLSWLDSDEEKEEKKPKAAELEKKGGPTFAQLKNKAQAKSNVQSLRFLR